MDGNELAIRVKNVKVGGELHRGGNGCGALCIEERVVTDDLHTQSLSGSSHQLADGTQADNAQRLACDLAASKLLLGLFGRLANVLIGSIRLAPFHAANDIARGKQHTGKHQLLHGVRVGTRRVKHGNARLSHGLKGNVVHARASTRNGLQIGRKGHFVHVSAAHQNGISLFDVVGQLILISQQSKADGRDIVQAMNLVHRIPLVDERFTHTRSEYPRTGA